MSSRRILKTLLGILNSSLVEWYYKRTTVPKANGFFIYNVMFLKTIPIPDADEIQTEGIAAIVDILLYISPVFSSVQSHATRDQLMLPFLKHILIGLVYELYFPEELHGAGLRLFDIVAKAKLPDINTIAESNRLTTLRDKFADLYDPSHPLRIALDKLQTLDTVRIIEGKA